MGRPGATRKQLRARESGAMCQTNGKDQQGVEAVYWVCGCRESEIERGRQEEANEKASSEVAEVEKQVRKGEIHRQEAAGGQGKAYGTPAGQNPPNQKTKVG